MAKDCASVQARIRLKDCLRVVSPVDAGDRVRPRSGGLVDSPLFSNMARRFLTWLMLAVYKAIGYGMVSRVCKVWSNWAGCGAARR